jgi:hypothetical protein
MVKLAEAIARDQSLLNKGFMSPSRKSLATASTAETSLDASRASISGSIVSNEQLAELFNKASPLQSSQSYHSCFSSPAKRSNAFTMTPASVSKSSVHGLIPDLDSETNSSSVDSFASPEGEWWDSANPKAEVIKKKKKTSSKKKSADTIKRSPSSPEKVTRRIKVDGTNSAVNPAMMEAMATSGGRRRVSAKELRDMGVEIPQHSRRSSDSTHHPSRSLSMSEEAANTQNTLQVSTQSKSRSHSRARSKSHEDDGPAVAKSLSAGLSSGRARSRSRVRRTVPSEEDSGCREESTTNAANNVDGDAKRARSRLRVATAPTEANAGQSRDEARSRCRSVGRSRNVASRGRSKSRVHTMGASDGDTERPQLENENGLGGSRRQLLGKDISYAQSNTSHHDDKERPQMQKENGRIGSRRQLLRKELSLGRCSISQHDDKERPQMQKEGGCSGSRRQLLRKESFRKEHMFNGLAHSSRGLAFSDHAVSPRKPEIPHDDNKHQTIPAIPKQIIVDPEEMELRAGVIDEHEGSNIDPNVDGNSDDMYLKIKGAGITLAQFRALASVGLTIAEG